MNRSVIISAFRFLIVAPLLFGCAAIGNNYSEKQLYALNVTPPVRKSPAENGPTLRVKRFSVSPLYEEKGFIYQEGDYDYRSDFYNEFFTAPGAMIASETMEWLDASGLFKQVMDTSIQAPFQYEMEGSISGLYGDYRNTHQPKAVMEIRFFLKNTTSLPEELIFHKRYHYKISLENDSASSLITGFNDALVMILSELERDLSELKLK